jgi:hypothetical protein
MFFPVRISSRITWRVWGSLVVPKKQKLPKFVNIDAFSLKVNQPITCDFGGALTWFSAIFYPRQHGSNIADGIKEHLSHHKYTWKTT